MLKYGNWFKPTSTYAYPNCSVVRTTLQLIHKEKVCEIKIVTHIDLPLFEY